MIDAENSRQKADLVLQNGIVYTVDKDRTKAEAVAARGKDVVFVGSNDRTSEYIGSNTETGDGV